MEELAVLVKKRWAMVEPPFPLKAFVCCSEEDMKQECLGNFMKFSSTLKKNGIVSFHSRKDILVGGDIEDKMNEFLNEANIVITLITQDLLNDEFFDKNIDNIKQRHDQKNIVHIPIIVKFCSYRTHKMLYSLEVLPKDNKPIIQKDTNIDERWTDIFDEIREAIIVHFPEVKNFLL